MAWLAVRVRGTIHARRDMVKTLSELRINRQNHATVVPENPSYLGMLNKVQGYITWGPVSNGTVSLLLKERGRTLANTPVDEKRLAELTELVMKDGLARVDELRPLFRLKPPKGGWKTTKKPFTMGGALGFRKPGAKDDIDALAKRMV